MIDDLYDAESASQIHYVPVDVNTTRLKDYIAEGKKAKMALLSEQANAKQVDEQIMAAKESLAAHTSEKPEHIQQKDKEKEVKKEQRRERHKAILQQNEEEINEEKVEETKSEQIDISES